VSIALGTQSRTRRTRAGQLLTLDNTVEFFNLILGTKLAPQEKQDLVAFLRAL